MTIAIAVSVFDKQISDLLVEGCRSQLQTLGIDTAAVPITSVPGAVELPIVAQQYARTGRYQAIICLGAVIRGDTGHYDVVCYQVSHGCQQVALSYHIPVIFGVLTAENRDQALARLGGTHGHKGRDAADTAVKMTQVMASLAEIT